MSVVKQVGIVQLRTLTGQLLSSRERFMSRLTLGHPVKGSNRRHSPACSVPFSWPPTPRTNYCPAFTQLCCVFVCLLVYLQE